MHYIYHVEMSEIFDLKFSVIEYTGLFDKVLHTDGNPLIVQNTLQYTDDIPHSTKYHSCTDVILHSTEQKFPRMILSKK